LHLLEADPPAAAWSSTATEPNANRATLSTRPKYQLYARRGEGIDGLFGWNTREGKRVTAFIVLILEHVPTSGVAMSRDRDDLVESHGLLDGHPKIGGN
jgi:hypothetical protein